MQHVTEDLLELYALNLVTGPELESVETHLLLCNRCRAEVQRTDDFIATLRSVAMPMQKCELQRGSVARIPTLSVATRADA